MKSRNVFFAVSLSLALAACAKSPADVAAEFHPAGGPDKPPASHKAVSGMLRNSPFKPTTAAVKHSAVSGEDQNYLSVYLVEDSTITDPCNQVGSASRFVMFYINKAAPVGHFDMSVRRGQTQGALFFDDSSAGTYAEWISTGYADVTSFDEQNGADITMNFTGGATNSLNGVIHAVVCNN